MVLENVDWIQLAPDTDQRTAVAKTVINLRVTKKAGKLRRSAIGCSKGL
jgi:hypothetical protein